MQIEIEPRTFVEVADWIGPVRAREMRSQILERAREYLRDWREERFGCQKRMANRLLKLAVSYRRRERMNFNTKAA